jgi:quinol monooxygenase YgiN
VRPGATLPDFWRRSLRIVGNWRDLDSLDVSIHAATGVIEEGIMAFELSAHMTVRPGQLEGFKRQAAECVRITKEKDTHTLRYDWFLSKDGTECEVREAYTGPEGLIEHNKNIIDARTKLFKDYADNHLMTVYSEPTQELIDLVKSHHLENQFKWFSFVKGLE